MRTTPKYVITLEGNSWEEVLQEMVIVQEGIRAARIEAKPERANIAKDCRKCQHDRYNKLTGILKSGYGLGTEEVAEILERVRQ